MADRKRVQAALRRAPVVLVVGPRQVGKSTLVNEIAADTKSTVFDLENPRHVARLEDPLLALEHLTGLVVIDEAQHAPELFPVLRVLADRPNRPATFLILGSAAPDLVGLGSETLAGRVEIIELSGLRLTDIGPDQIDRLWSQGGLPLAYNNPPTDSAIWRDSYITTFLERDLPQLGFRIPATEMRRFWTMLAHYHAQTWNGAELSRAAGLSEKVLRRYLDALTDSLVVRQLQPWFANTKKRLVRSPKIYIRDTGVLHRLLSLDNIESLLNHPKIGASWEGFVIEQLALVLDNPSFYFWATHGGAELDVYLELNGKPLGIEIKRTSSPKLTPSMRSAIDTLGLHRLIIAYPGPDRFSLTPTVEAVPVSTLLTKEGRDILLA